MMSKIFILSILVLNSCASQKPNNISKKATLDSISIDGDWEVISIHSCLDRFEFCIHNLSEIFIKLRSEICL